MHSHFSASSDDLRQFSDRLRPPTLLARADEVIE
jgi:hypothetical protein